MESQTSPMVISDILNEINSKTPYTLIDITLSIERLCLNKPHCEKSRIAFRNTYHNLLETPNIVLISKLTDITTPFLMSGYNKMYPNVFYDLVSRYLLLKKTDSYLDISSIKYSPDFKFFYREVLRFIEKTDALCNTCFDKDSCINCAVCGYGNCTRCLLNLIELHKYKTMCMCFEHTQYECPQCRLLRGVTCETIFN